MPETPPTGISGEGHSSYEEEFRAIGHILENDAERIMKRWFERALRPTWPRRGGASSELVDAIFKAAQGTGSG